MISNIWSSGRSLLNHYSSSVRSVVRRRPTFGKDRTKSAYFGDKKDQDASAQSTYKPKSAMRPRRTDYDDDEDDIDKSTSYLLKPLHKPYRERPSYGDRERSGSDRSSSERSEYKPKWADGDRSSGYRPFSNSGSRERRPYEGKRFGGSEESDYKPKWAGGDNERSPSSSGFKPFNKSFGERRPYEGRRFSGAEGSEGREGRSKPWQVANSGRFEREPRRFDRDSKGDRDNSDTKKSENPLIDRFEQLIGNKKYREKEKAMAVPGLVALQACDKDHIKTILACSKETVEKLDTLVGLSKETRIDYITQSQMIALINEKNPDAIVAEVVKPEIAPFEEGILDVRKRWIAVNGLRDGANFGLLIRTAGCLKWDGVIMIGEGNVNPFNLQTIRASAGAVFKMPFFVAPDFAALEKAQIVLGEVPAKAEESTKLDFDRPIVLVIGGEKDGHQTLPVGTAHHLTIPTVESFGSLNAAIAGAIMMNSINQNRTKIN